MKTTPFAVPFCLLLFFCLLLHPVAAPASDQQADNGSGDQAQLSCAATVRLLAEHDAKVSRELHRIQRDLAALEARITEPGLGEAVAGIGYIAGLFGLAAFLVARRNSNREKGGK